MKDIHEKSRDAFDVLYRHQNTYDTSQNIRDHIEGTNAIAWCAWCAALDYTAEQQADADALRAQLAAAQSEAAALRVSWQNAEQREARLTARLVAIYEFLTPQQPQTNKEQ